MAFLLQISNKINYKVNLKLHYFYLTILYVNMLCQASLQFYCTLLFCLTFLPEHVIRTSSWLHVTIIAT